MLDIDYRAIHESIRQAEEKQVSVDAQKHSNKLWTSLKQLAKRQLFFTEQQSEMTQTDFISKVSKKLEENGVPAEIEIKEIQWDDSNITSKNYTVQIKESSINPIVCLLQFNHVGKFSFVETKNFITPPDLPKMPEKPRPIDVGAPKMALTLGAFGLIGLAIAYFIYNKWQTTPSTVAGSIGGVLLFAAFVIYSSYSSDVAHNAQCIREEIAWNKAWQDWRNTHFIHAFQEITNGSLSRIYDAVFETVKQVSNEIFKGVSQETQTEVSDMNTLENQMERRRNEYR